MRLRATLAIAVLAYCSNALASESSGGMFARPVAQAGIPSSASYGSRTVTFPTSGSFSFNYFVDSEQSFDFLRVYLDGVQSAAWSGPSQAGRYQIPVSAGSHTIQFAYTKDGSVDRGLDIGCIDGFTAADAQGDLFASTFNERRANAAGWTVNGTGGGFVKTPLLKPRVLRRPNSQAFAGYHSATVSASDRIFTWTGSSPYTLDFDYLVDSEAGYDFLRVYVDGVEAWNKSGQDMGRASIPIASSGGHTVSFRYTKDTSVDVGRDLGYIDNVSPLAAGVGTEIQTFNGYAYDTVPYGWSTTGAAGGLVVAAVDPPRVQVARTNPSASPVIDGTISFNLNASEYTTPNRLMMRDTTDRTGRIGTVLLQELDSAQSLVVAGRLHSTTLASGTESGAITLYFDSNRNLTLNGRACGTGGSLPSQEDRKFVLTYSSGAGGQPTLSGTQYLGTCGGWLALPSGDASAWPIVYGLTEAYGDYGYLHFEARVKLCTAGESACGPLSDGRIGFQITHQRTSGGFDCFPLRQGGCGVDLDTLTWSTLEFGNLPLSGGATESGPWVVTPVFY